MQVKQYAFNNHTDDLVHWKIVVSTILNNLQYTVKANLWHYFVHFYYREWWSSQNYIWTSQVKLNENIFFLRHQQWILRHRICLLSNRITRSVAYLISDIFPRSFSCKLQNTFEASAQFCIMRQHISRLKILNRFCYCFEPKSMAFRV